LGGVPFDRRRGNAPCLWLGGRVMDSGLSTISKAEPNSAVASILERKS